MALFSQTRLLHRQNQRATLGAEYRSHILRCPEIYRLLGTAAPTRIRVYCHLLQPEALDANGWPREIRGKFGEICGHTASFLMFSLCTNQELQEPSVLSLSFPKFPFARIKNYRNHSVCP